MSISFKVFRVLTNINLMIIGFFLVSSLMSMAFLPSLSQGLLVMMVLGVVFIHSVLSLYLQRSLLHPEIPLKENTPGGIRIMGVLAILYALYMIAGCLLFLGIRSDDAIKEMMEQLPAEQQNVSITAVKKVMNGFLTFIILHGFAVLVNCILSFFFLKKWKQTQETIAAQQQDIDTDDEPYQ